MGCAMVVSGGSHEAREADVVEANDGDILRHSQPTGFDGPQGAYGHLVIRAEDGRERHAAGKQGVPRNGCLIPRKSLLPPSIYGCA